MSAPRAYDLLASLVPRLQQIRIANGYRTEAGQSVVLGPIERMPGEPVPFIRLHDLGAAPESYVPHRPVAKMRTAFLVEAYAQFTERAECVRLYHDLAADLRRALFGDLLRDLDGAVIEATLDACTFVPPEPGSDVVIAQLRGGFAYTERFNQP